MASTAPIGVFDSGLGGISVAREIRRDMPNEHVLYFGDSANAPYGTKSPEQVRELSDVIVKRFVEQGVKAVVIACNTATSAAANELRDTYDIPIIGMEPALKVACDRGHGKRQRVIVAATPLTCLIRRRSSTAMKAPCVTLAWCSNRWASSLRKTRKAASIWPIPTLPHESRSWRSRCLIAERECPDRPRKVE